MIIGGTFFFFFKMKYLRAQASERWCGGGDDTVLL